MMARNNNQSRKHISGVEQSEINYLMPEYLDFLIAVSIAYSTDLPNNKYNLRKWQDRAYIAQVLGDLSDEINKEFIDDEVFLWLKSFAFNQMKQYHHNPIEQLYRYYMIFSYPGVVENVENKIGMSYKEFIFSAFWLYSKFFDNFQYHENQITNLGEKYVSTPFSENNLKKTLSLLSIDYKTIKEISKKRIDYSKELIFNNPNFPHIQHPLIQYSDFYFCVNPQYLIDKFTVHVYNIAELYAGNQNYGKAFESYIGKLLNEIIKYNSATGFFVFPEQLYNKGQERTSDWIVLDNENILFIECKAKRLTALSKIDMEIDNQFVKDVIQNNWFTSATKDNIRNCEKPLTKDAIILGIEVGKVYKAYDDYANNKISNLPFDSNKVFRPILVTLEEWYAGIPDVKNVIIQIAQSYLNYKSIDATIVDKFPIIIMSASSFTIDFQIMTKHGINQYYQLKSNNELTNEKNIFNFELIKDLFNKELFEPLTKEINKTEK